MQALPDTITTLTLVRNQIIHHVTIHNTNTAAITAQLAINDGTNDVIWAEPRIAGKDTFVFDWKDTGLILPNGYTLRGLSDTPNVNIIIGGVLY